MAFTENIKLVVDVVTGNAKGALSGLKSDVDAAEGSFNKVKAAAGGMLTGIASSPAALLAVGTAVAGFAAKSIGEFQKTALAADKFRDSTGLSLDESSRWIAVADDVGISAETLQTAFSKMEKAMGTNKAAFGDLIVTAKGGGTDLNATFLNVIQHLQGIKDPIDRATEASKLFGKGFAGVSELLGTSADKLKEKLSQVSDAQVINEAEVAKARKFQGAMDDLGDSVGDVERNIGSALVPSLAKLVALAANTITITVDFTTKGAEVLTQLDKSTGGIFGDLKDAALGALNPAKHAVDVLADAYGVSLEATKRLGLGQDVLAQAVGNSGHNFLAHRDAVQGAADAADGAAAAEKNYADSLKASEDAAKAATDAIKGKADAARAAADADFAAADAQDKLTEFLATYNEKAAAAAGNQTELNQLNRDGAQAVIDLADATVRQAEETAAAGGQTLDASKKIETFNHAALSQATNLQGPARDALVNYIAKVNDIPPEKVSDIKALIDQGKIAEAESALNNASRTRNSALIASVLGISAAENALNSLTRTRNAIINAQIVTKGAAGFNTTGTPKFAEGGTVPGPKGSPLLAVVHGGEEVISNKNLDAARAGRLGSGGQTNITINLPAGSDPTATKRAVDRWASRNGTLR